MKNQNDYLGQTKVAYCTDEGIVLVEDLVQKQILYKFDIFCDRYQYLLYEWNIIPKFVFFESLEWVSAPLDIDNRKLVTFLNNNEFIYVNKEKELVWVKQDICGQWKIKTKIVREEIASFKNIFDIEYDSVENAILCYEGEKRVYVKI